MKEDCVGIQGPQRILALKEKRKKSNNKKKITMRCVRYVAGV
jgi:hypothetical protein